ncbi:MAG: hypothetical protein JSU58_05285 [Dehalococcoidales bacterium]|nr:MAG: hypothetical protein JSU58_05285 [Dehalococcoidales bacterium]
MVKRGGNPSWYKGMPSANPKGRPRGKTTLYTFLQNPKRFQVNIFRWERFCWGLLEHPYTGAAAARKAGYSPKSARFIASRLRRNPVVIEMLRRIRKRIDDTRKIGDGVYLIPDDDGVYSVYEDKNVRKRVEAELEAIFKKRRR